MTTNAARECKFAVKCGGGHTTAQHYLHVYERGIKGACGIAVFNELELVVNAEAARADD